MTTLREGAPESVSDEELDIVRLKARIDHRLNDYLSDMKEGYDDSITGFNEAWDIVRALFAAEIERLQSRRSAPPAEELAKAAKRVDAYVGYPGERSDVRALVVEECAKVADDFAQRGQSKANKIHAAYEIAYRIRALAIPAGEEKDHG
jgi:hypothetical protein